jgi:hypothetical protein
MELTMPARVSTRSSRGCCSIRGEYSVGSTPGTPEACDGHGSGIAESMDERELVIPGEYCATTRCGRRSQVAACFRLGLRSHRRIS